MKLFLHLACWRQVWNGETKSITELSDGDRLYNPRYHLISSAAPRHTLKQQHGWKFRHKLVRAERRETSEYNRAILYYTVLYSGAGVPGAYNGRWSPVLLSVCTLALWWRYDGREDKLNSKLTLNVYPGWIASYCHTRLQRVSHLRLISTFNLMAWLRSASVGTGHSI